MNHDSDKVIKPIKFVKEGEEWRKSPFLDFSKNIDNETRFMITKFTDNGKYVRGDNHLYYNMKGISIYTDINDIIFVDLSSDRIFIRRSEKVTKNLSQTSPEEREYILLFTDLGYEEKDKDNFNFPLRWEAVIGRNSAYSICKDNLSVIDIDKSLVLVENVELKDSLTVREFIDYLQNSDMVEKEEINLDEWSSSEYI